MDVHLTSNALLTSIADPTDWDTTTLPLLHPLDSALRCQICKDFFTAPVITACLHTFCSECIRRALHADKICPICRTAEQEYRLRKNQVVEDLVDAFLKARPQLLDVAKKVLEEGPNTEEEGEVVEGEEMVGEAVVEGLRGSPPKKKVRASPRGKRSTRSAPRYKEEVDEDVVEVLAPSDGLVPCPSCNKRMKLDLVNSHLDNCLSDEYKPSSSAPSKSSLSLRTSTTRSSNAPSSSKPTAPLQPLPKINYSTIKEKDLRAKLSAIGIPSTGTRKNLQERYSEWMTIWNANVDAKRPRNKTELLAELNSWERANAKPSNQIVKAKWSNEQWHNDHNSHFRQLAKEARERAVAAKREMLEVEVEEGAKNVEGVRRVRGAEAKSTSPSVLAPTTGPLVYGFNESGAPMTTTTTEPSLGFPQVAPHMSQDSSTMNVDSQHNGKRKFNEINGSSTPVTETV